MHDKVILSIETSTKICGSALIKGDSCIALKEDCVPRKHAELLPSFVKTVLSNADIKKNKFLLTTVPPFLFLTFNSNL